MKSALEHFARLHLIPPNKKAEYDFKKMVMRLLPQSISIYISNIFVKNKILYICVNHEGVVFEMDYKLKALKSMILDMVKNLNVDYLIFNNIKVYFKAEITQAKQVVKWSEKERSDGKFENHMQNSKLYDLVEEIRCLICKNH